MLFDISNFGHYKKIVINDDDGNPVFQLGLQDLGDRQELAIELLNAVRELIYNDMHDSVDYHNFLKVHS